MKYQIENVNKSNLNKISMKTRCFFFFSRFSNEKSDILIAKFKQIKKTYFINKIFLIVQKFHLKSCFIIQNVL